nr:Uncharacterised protein [Raoultella sp. NCTC 9187]
MDARVLFIFEQRLAFLHPVRLPEPPLRAHTDVLLAQQRNAFDCNLGSRLLYWHASYGQIKPFFYFNHIVSRCP